MKKEELTKRIRADRARFDALVAGLDAARLVEPSLEGGWSVKDVLAHVSVWERLCTAWFAAAARGETPDRAEVRDVDGFNARSYRDAKDRPLADVLAESRLSHGAIVAVIEGMSEAELADEQRFGRPAWQMASANSDDHYREHIEQIARWLCRSET